MKYCCCCFFCNLLIRSMRKFVLKDQVQWKIYSGFMCCILTWLHIHWIPLTKQIHSDQALSFQTKFSQIMNPSKLRLVQFENNCIWYIECTSLNWHYHDMCHGPMSCFHSTKLLSTACTWCRKGSCCDAPYVGMLPNDKKQKEEKL